MAIVNEQGRLNKDQKRWIAEHKKWGKEHKKVQQVLRNLEGAIKHHTNEVKAFEKQSRFNGTKLTNGHNTPAARKRVKATHQKLSQHHKLHARAHKNIVGLVRHIEKAVKTIY